MRAHAPGSGGGGRAFPAGRSRSEMPVKRSLKLDVLLQENSPKSVRTRGQFIASYSPVTGTRQISPYSSPKGHGPEIGNRSADARPCAQKNMEPDQSPGSPRRGQPRTEDEEIVMLLCKIDKSLEKFTETWQSLKHLQALVGQPELENLIGIFQPSLDLKSEVQKTRELVMKVRKEKWLKNKTPKRFTRDPGRVNSYEFLKSLAN